VTEHLAIDRVIVLRRAWRYDDAERLIKEQLSGSTAEVELGRIAVQRGRYALAAEHVERALAISPDCEAANAWHVAILSRRLRYAEARAVADEALVVTPKAHLVRLARARVADDETGDVQYLLGEVEAILKEDPDHVDALEQRISVLGALARYDDAIAAAEDAMRRHPDAAELLLRTAEVLADMGRFPEAVEHCERALAIQPGYVDAWYDISDYLQDAERHDEALTNAKQAVLANPEVSRLYLALGWTLAGIDDHNGALSNFEKAVKLDPEIAMCHWWVAFALRVLGRLDEALEVIHEGCERFPDSIGLLLEKARLHSSVDDLAAALAASAKALAIDSKSSSAIRCHVDILRQSRKYDEAETVARSGIEIRPNDADMLASLGWVYAWQDRDREALDCFRRALALRPNSPDIISNVCAAMRWLYCDAEAELLLVEVRPRLSDPAALVMESAMINERAGRYDEALALYRRINEETPRYAPAWYNRIAAFRNQRRLAEAEQAARKAIDVNPFSADLRLALALVHDARGDESGTIATLREACADLPNRVMLAHLLALFLRMSGDFDEAWKTLTTLPGTASTERERIALWREARDHRRAIEIAMAAVSCYPHDVRFRIALGELKEAQDDDEAALAEYEVALTVDRASRPALRGKAKCLRKLRRFAECERFLIAEIARLPNYTMIRMELAWTYSQMERRDDGIAQYEQALKVDPRSSLLLRNYANALSLMGRWKNAEQILSDAIDQFPQDAWLMTRRGELCDTLNQREEALTWFDRALAIAPRATWPLKAKSATLRSLGRFDEAERLLAPALKRRTVTSDVVVEWGWVLRDRGQLTQSRHAFERALTLTVGRRDRADVLHGLGWVAFSANDFQQAVAHFREALDEHSESLDAKLGLAWTLLRDGRPNGEAEAERLCLEVLDRRPRRHLAHTCLGVLYTHQNNLPQAEHHLRRAIEIDPYGGSYVDLGALFVQMDRFEEAEALLRKALDRDWYDSQACTSSGTSTLTKRAPMRGRQLNTSGRRWSLIHHRERRRLGYPSR
jgi:tetratricopeptide (TPR) repeat protein